MNHKALKPKFQALAAGPISEQFLSLTHILHGISLVERIVGVKVTCHM